MRPWACIGLLVILGCTPTPDVPTIPPPPEDLSTWSVPELVQPPAPPPHSPAPVEDKATSAERIYDFTPGTTFALTVPVGWPLDVLLERGEQVRNIVGGDRAPTETNQGPRCSQRQCPRTHHRRDYHHHETHVLPDV